MEIQITENQKNSLFQLNENINDKVYHFTSLQSVYDILTSDTMYCQFSVDNSDYSSDKYNFYISFTRNKSPYEGFGYQRSNGYRAITARIEFDGNKLSNNFKGGAYNYWGAGEGLMNKWYYQRRASGVEDGTKNDAFHYTKIESAPEGVDVKHIKNINDSFVKYPTSKSPDYIEYNDNFYKKEPLYDKIKKIDFNDSDIKNHVDNEFEDRILTNKSTIDNISKYITRIDVLINTKEDLSNKTSSLLYHLSSHKNIVFIYDNLKDFNFQTENTINDRIYNDENAYGKYGDGVPQRKESGVHKTDLIYIMNVLTLLKSNDEKIPFAAKLLKQYGIGKKINEIAEGLKYPKWFNIDDLINTAKNYLFNFSKSPNREGQIVLQMVSDELRRNNFKSLKDYAIAFKNQFKDNKTSYDDIDTTSLKKFKVFKNGYTNFDITNDSETDVWYLLGCYDLNDRYNIIENIIGDINYYLGYDHYSSLKSGNLESFRKYLQSLAHQKVTFKQFISILKKIGLNGESIKGILGYPKIFTKEYDYWSYRLQPPFRCEDEFKYRDNKFQKQETLNENVEDDEYMIGSEGQVGDRNMNYSHVVKENLDNIDHKLYHFTWLAGLTGIFHDGEITDSLMNGGISVTRNKNSNVGYGIKFPEENGFCRICLNPQEILKIRGVKIVPFSFFSTSKTSAKQIDIYTSLVKNNESEEVIITDKIGINCIDHIDILIPKEIGSYELLCLKQINYFSNRLDIRAYNDRNNLNLEKNYIPFSDFMKSLEVKTYPIDENNNILTEKEKSFLNNLLCEWGLKDVPDISTIGDFIYDMDFDEDEYQEYLQEWELQDTLEEKIKYIKENVYFNFEFTDNVYHHTLCYTELSYDDIENIDEVGEELAKVVLRDCLEDGHGRIEKLLLINDDINIDDPKELNAAALRILPHGEYFKGCRGFILTDGHIVYTEAEHNHCSEIPGIKGTFDFIKRGNIRILTDSIDVWTKPTKEQRMVLVNIPRYYRNETLYISVKRNGVEECKQFENPNAEEILRYIDSVYGVNESIKKHNILNENRNIIRFNGKEIYWSGKRAFAFIYFNGKLLFSTEFGTHEEALAKYFVERSGANFKDFYTNRNMNWKKYYAFFPSTAKIIDDTLEDKSTPLGRIFYVENCTIVAFDNDFKYDIEYIINDLYNMGYINDFDNLYISFDENEEPKPYNNINESVKYSKNILNEENNTPQSVEEYNQIAKQYFGVTNSFKACGYLLTDGSLLDFSGYKFGSGDKNNRYMDHREIYKMGYTEDDDKLFEIDMNSFMNMGNIRIKATSPGFDLVKEPTDKQYAILSLFISKFRNYSDEGYFFIDISKENGDPLYCVIYIKPTSQRVISDLIKYFREGIVPEGDEQDDYHPTLGFGENKIREICITEEQKKKLFLETLNNQDAPLYHFTNFRFLPRILQDGYIRKKYYNHISFTRNRNNNVGYPSSSYQKSLIRFKFDPNKLLKLRNSNINQYSFYYIKDEDTESAKQAKINYKDNELDEFEERINLDTISLDCCDYIDILIDKNCNYSYINLLSDCCNLNYSNKIRVFTNQNDFNFERNWVTINDFFKN